jgi:hypothetical protein
MPVVVIEGVEVSTSFPVRPDGTLEAEGVHGYGRGTLSLHAVCACGHEWNIPMSKALKLLSEKGS